MRTSFKTYFGGKSQHLSLVTLGRLLSDLCEAQLVRPKFYAETDHFWMDEDEMIYLVQVRPLRLGGPEGERFHVRVSWRPATAETRSLIRAANFLNPIGDAEAVTFGEI